MKRPIHLVGLIVASMVGSGVFTTSGFALADLGSRELVVFAWVLGAAHAICGAVAYGWLARRHPESGGEYLLLTRTVHPAAGYIAGWVSIFAGFVAPIAAAAHGLEAYVQMEGVLWIGAAAIALATALHAVGTSFGAFAQTGIVAFKLLLLGAFVAFGLYAIGDFPQIGEHAGDWTQLGPTLVWVSFSYSGWNAAIYLSGELDDELRDDIPKWSAVAVGIVGVLYVAINALFVYGAPYDKVAGRPDVGMAAAEAIGGDALAFGLAAIVSVGLVTSISSMMMAGPRVIWKMARDGALPEVLGRGEVPRVAIITQGVLSIAVFVASDLAQLLSYIGLTLSISAALTVMGIFAQWERGEASPSTGAIVTAAIFSVSTLAMACWISWIQPLNALASLGTIVLGLGAWALQRPHED